MTAEEIAAGLSEAQRWAVQTGLCPSGQRRSPMKRSLEALGLWRPDGTFTPLCQQVRLVLGVKWLPGVKPVRAILESNHDRA